MVLLKVYNVSCAPFGSTFEVLLVGNPDRLLFSLCFRECDIRSVFCFLCCFLLLVEAILLDYIICTIENLYNVFFNEK